jgi:beta-lactamase class A
MSQAFAQELDSLAQSEHVQAAVVAAFTDGQPIVSLRPQVPYYPASVIKVPIMVEVFAQAHKGELSLSERLPISAEDQVTGSGVLRFLTPGLRLPIRDLVTLMIVVSDNTATNVLIDRVGVERVNATMRSLGLEHTELHNRLQIQPAHVAARNVTTAQDMTRLLLLLAQGKAVSWDASRRMVDILLRQTNKEGLGGLLPLEPPDAQTVGALPTLQVASKSGYVPGLVHDVGLILRPKRSYAISILLQGAASHRAGTDLIARLSRRVYDFVREQEG